VSGEAPAGAGQQPVKLEAASAARSSETAALTAMETQMRAMLLTAKVASTYAEELNGYIITTCSVGKKRGKAEAQGSGRAIFFFAERRACRKKSQKFRAGAARDFETTDWGCSSLV
jgi:hypothetical protein